MREPKFLERGDKYYGTYKSQYECFCGRTFIAIENNVNTGNTKSCGCLKKYAMRKNRQTGGAQTHGRSSTNVYGVWQTMIQRCSNPNNHKYSLYGGRGITVCWEWTDFANFYRDMGDPPRGYSIDRINNNGNYEAANCRWATAKQQANNTRRNK